MERLLVRGTESRAVRCEMNDPILEPHDPNVDDAVVGCPPLPLFPLTVVELTLAPAAVGALFDNDNGRNPEPYCAEKFENSEDRALCVPLGPSDLDLAKSTSDRLISTGVLDTLPSLTEDNELVDL